MTFKKPSRAGLAALVFGILLSLFLSVSTFTHTSYAEEAAPPPTEQQSPPACAGNPDPKKAVLKNCTPNSGDTAWMLTSTALVLMMTIPGLGLFYAGMVRKKNVLATVMQSFAITCAVTILWMVVGYSIAFTNADPSVPGKYIGSFAHMFLAGVNVNTAN